MSDSTPKKQCTVCGESLPATDDYFHRSKFTKDGWYYDCKTCRRKLSQEYSKRPDVHKRKTAYYKEWVSKNKEKVRCYHRNYEHIRYARKKGILGTHTTEQIQALLIRQKHRCYYCLKQLEKRNGKYIYQIDHTFPINRVAGTDIPANDISYLVLTCRSCNAKKQDKYPWEFHEGGRLL